MPPCPIGQRLGALARVIHVLGGLIMASAAYALTRLTLHVWE